MLTFSDGLSFPPALLEKVCCSVINMKEENLGKCREEKNKKNQNKTDKQTNKRKISGIEETAHVVLEGILELQCSPGC